MKRQGLKVTIKELRDLADEFESLVAQNPDLVEESGFNTTFQINIINKSGLSDEWEIEKLKMENLKDE